MHCNWTKDRSKGKSTYGLKYHLQHSHPTLFKLFSQKLEAERIKEKEDHKRKSAQQKLDFVKRPKIALGTDILFEEETSSLLVLLIGFEN
jgi:hypothetical protein